ncbi:MAG TPA: ATP-binding cassette domain-containing protein [Actinomycetales bacterium]|nr:ATP-binding cassette domain-containing protein [Actinomycetales bacterium]
MAARFGERPWLFGNLNLTLTAGDMVGVVGPSGSGKSTLLSILAGELAPTRGTVHRDGADRIGWVFQNPYGVAHRTALDHVTLPLLAHGATRTDADHRALDLLARFGLREVASSPFSALSGGEGQRLQLARAVASEPDLLLVDEPTAQLDSQTAAGVNAILGELASSGAAVVIATHDLRTASQCQQILDLGDHPMEPDDAAA